MWTDFLKPLSVSLCLVVPTFAHAGCLQDPRKIETDGKEIVRLKSYLCEAPDSRARIKVEFHRFSVNAAAVIVQGKSSTLVERLIGKPRIIKNEIFDELSSILARFGRNESTFVQGEGAEVGPSLSLNGFNQISGVDIGLKREKFLKTIDDGTAFALPISANDLKSLVDNKLPSEMKFFYSCASGTCDSPRDDFGPVVWRAFSIADLDSFSTNATNYNEYIRHLFKDKDTIRDSSIDAVDSNWQSLLRYIAGNKELPSNFLPLVGTFSEPAVCGGDASKKIWQFHVYTRRLMFDFVVITNVSRQPVTVESVVSAQSLQSGLRSASIGLPSKGALKPLDGTGSLNSGESILLPLRINFLKPFIEELDPTLSNKIRQRAVAVGLTRNADAYGLPDFPDYVFGPELGVTGLVVNGSKIDFEEHATNFTEFALGSGPGSCPYLLSWDDSESAWTSHGKVLHQADKKELESTETITFPGFKAHFRLEEREPEIATIARTELEVDLKSGQSITLVPAEAGFGERDLFARLFWSEAINFEFKLPKEIYVEDVVQSRLKLTGYYQRYSALAKITSGVDENDHSDLLSRLTRRQPATASQNGLSAP